MKLSVKEINQNYGVSRRILQKYEKLKLIHATKKINIVNFIMMKKLLEELC
ncbi:MAG: hypothetical protein PUC07_07695 [Solobacterium sp.]|nr:hypothetical protein [Solobacterium sp.]